MPGTRPTPGSFSAGASAQLIARDGDYVTLRVRSGEMRKVHSDCRATIGEVGNKAGAPVKLLGYVRMQLGEGIEKAVDDFAAEVAKAAGQA